MKESHWEKNSIQESSYLFSITYKYLVGKVFVCYQETYIEIRKKNIEIET